MERLLAHHQDPAPSLRALRPEIPPDLDAAYLKMMAKDPADRPQSMAKVIEWLEFCRNARPDGRMLLVFNDESRAKPAEVAPPVNSDPLPPPKSTASDQDLSGYDLLPPAVSELWTARSTVPKVDRSPGTSKEEPATRGPSWRAILTAIAVALLTSAILAAYLGARPRPPGAPPPPPPTRSGPLAP